MSTDLVGNRYRPLRKIGQGGMGAVYVAEDTIQGSTRVALKVGRPDAASRAHIAHLEREFRTLTQLRHPGIAAVHDFGIVSHPIRLDAEGNEYIPKGSHFLVEEYVPGVDLFKAAEPLRKGKGDGAAFGAIGDYDHLYEVVAEICRALDYIHSRGLLHCDVKPANIVYRTSGREEEAHVREARGHRLGHASCGENPLPWLTKIMDFGLAAERPSPAGVVPARGTLHYMAPEMLRGEGADRRADLYSLGITLYHVVTGMHAFDGESAQVLARKIVEEETPPPSTLRSNIPDALEEVILKLTRKSPDDRFQNAAEVVESINSWTGKKLPLQTAQTVECYVASGRLVGRDKEISSFKSALRALASGTPPRAGILVGGARGTGKSRLIQEFRYLSRLAGIPFLEAACYEGATSSWDPFTRILKQMLETLDIPSWTRDRFAPMLTRLLPEFAGERRPPAARETPQEHDALRLMTTVCDFLIEVARRSPLVVCLHDLHDADAGAVRLLRHLVRAASVEVLPVATRELIPTEYPARAGFFICGTFRDDVFEASPFAEALDELKRYEVLDVVALECLNREEAGELIRSMLGQDDLPPSLERFVVEKSGGNPLFIEEIMRSLATKGGVAYKSGKWVASQDDFEGFRIPERIAEVLSELLEGLGEQERFVLEVLSVADRPLTHLILQEATRPERPALLETIDALVVKGILAKEPTRRSFQYFEFAHPAMRDVLYHSLSPARKEELHRRLALVLEEICRGRLEEKSEELAYHFSNARESEKTILYATKAASKARQECAHKKAIGFLETALGFLPDGADQERIEMLETLGDVSVAAGRLNEAVEAFQSALRLSRDARHQAALHVKMGKAHCKSRKLDDALTHLETAHGMLEGIAEPLLLGFACRELGRVHELNRDYEKAIGYCLRSLEVLKPTGNAKEIADSWVVLGNQHLHLRDYDKAKECYATAGRIYHEISDTAGLSAVSNNLAGLCYSLRDFDASLSHQKRSLEIDEKEGNVLGMCESYRNLSLTYKGMGNVDMAVQCLLKAAWMAERTGLSFEALSALNSLGTIHIGIAQYENALKSLKRSLDISNRAGLWVESVQPHFNLANVFLILGDFDAASEHARKALEIVTEYKASKFEAYVHEIMGRTHGARREYEEARRCFERASRLLSSHQDLTLEGWLSCDRAEMALEMGEHLAASKLCNEGLKTAEQIEDAGLLSKLYMLKGSAEARIGNRKKALKYLEKSLRICEQENIPDIKWRIHSIIAEIQEGEGQSHLASEHYECAARTIEAVTSQLSPRLRKLYLQSRRSVASKRELARMEWEGKATPQTPDSREPHLFTTATQGTHKMNHDKRQKEKELSFTPSDDIFAAIEKIDAGTRKDAIGKLFHINQRMMSEHSLPALLELIMDSAVDLTNAERGFLILKKGEEMSFEVARNIDHKEILQPEFEVSYSIGEQVIKSGEPVLAIDAQEDGKLRKIGSVADLKLRSVLCIPLKVRDRVLGMVYLDNRSIAGAFSHEHLELVQLFGNQAAIAIENARLFEESVTDRLTTMYVHNHFLAHLERELTEAVQNLAPVSLMLIDIDRFKLVNDVYGHETGNIVIREISEHIRDLVTTMEQPGVTLPRKVILGRYGGDELEVAMTGTAGQDILDIAEKLRKTIEERSFEPCGQPDSGKAVSPAAHPSSKRLELTVSIGIAIFPEDATTAATLVQRADDALYNAKRDGRNRVYRAGQEDRPAKTSLTQPAMAVASLPLSRDGLSLVNMMSRIIQCELDLDRLLDLVIGMIVEVAKAERGFIMLAGEGGDLEFKAARNINQSEVTSPQFEISYSIAREVVEKGRPVLLENALDDERFKKKDSVAALHLRSVLVVPIEAKEGVAGLIYLDNRYYTKRFVEEDMLLVTAFAKQIAQSIQNSIEHERQKKELDGARQRLRQRFSYDRIVGTTPAMQELFNLLDKVVPTHYPVVIEGETGSGKELVANAIHYNGPRKNGPFVAVNCSALSESILEAELFGYAKGAFTGADRDKAGLFEEAHGGTLFLDEIGDMSANMQMKLMRVLQEGEIRPVGGKGSKRVDVRVIAASNKNLKNLVASGDFRSDLYYRLNVAKICIPPLRDRMEDVPALVSHFLRESVPDEPAPSIEKDAMNAILSHHWPGNVRELKNCIQRALLLSGGASINSRHVIVETEPTRAAAPESPRHLPHPPPEKPTPSLAEYHLTDSQEQIVLYSRSRGRISTEKCAQLLNVSRATAFRHLDELVSKQLLVRHGKGRSTYYAPR